ncbi:MarR family EPS-associated transcriptional regulator [Alcaligenaceae bacterium]|nr:MarR family EPS-associated transcriptional regulator [Alcaligenaceae bacterium]
MSVTVPHSDLYEESHLKVLRLLEAHPELSQRELAERLGVSLGKTNYCVRHLLDKGLLKINNFRNSRNKVAYAYLLTPAGIAAKAELTSRFLKQKMYEYEVLKADIELLRKESMSKNDVTDEYERPR